MSEQSVIDLAAQAILVTMKVGAPALLAILVVGFVVSVFQAATQINEQTLSFIPKVLAMTAAVLFTGPWVLKTMIFFTTQIFNRLPAVTH